jgi:hypothetical protein
MVSKTFDALQRVMKMQEAIKQRERGSFKATPPPGTKLEPTPGPDKEVLPMGNEYDRHPPLDRKALRDGYKLCVGNATRLMSEAREFWDAGRCRSAYLILSLALEELANAVQLYDAGCSGVEDWQAWWARYFSHPKRLESTVPGFPRMKETDERLNVVREELVYVDFDRDGGRFKPPREDKDSELARLFETEVTYADAVLNALPPHAFERWEFEDTVHASPELVSTVLYARVEEILSQEPSVDEKDLLTAIASDLGRPPDVFAAGYEHWKKAAPKARVYLDLLRRVQNSLKKERETEGAG